MKKIKIIGNLILVLSGFHLDRAIDEASRYDLDKKIQKRKEEVRKKKRKKQIQQVNTK